MTALRSVPIDDNQDVPPTLGGLIQTPAASSGDGPADLRADVLAEAARAAVAQAAPENALRAVIDMAVLTGPCDAASITALGARRSVSTVAASNERVREADHLQYRFGEGPCLDAVWTDGVFLIPNLAADGRWPRWAPEAKRLGIASSISVHLFADTKLGSLNMYSLAPRTFSDTDVENARVIAAQASVVVAYTHTREHLWRAVDGRNLIGQAQGILMQRYGLTAEKAFAVLRRYSQTHNIKLVKVAEQLTTTGSLPGLDDAPTPGADPI
jgi:transcriptional regulator with GAF, ATPase, and Fis domain